MDLIVDALVLDEDRLKHIARHQVTIEEVLEIVSGDYVFVQGHHERWLLIGKTTQGRFLTVVVGARSQRNTFGLVTARPASRDERGLYRELALEEGGEERGQD